MPNQNKKVIERILARKNGAKDNYKIGLIFEGGGMRGQFSSGAAVGFHKLGLTDCFDYIYGSSSGSCAAAYLASGNIKDASAIYHEYLSGFRFIKPWKLKKVIDIDYLCDEVFRNHVPLDFSKLKSVKPEVKIFVSGLNDASGYCFTNRDDVDHYEVIKASCAVPGYYNKPVQIGEIQALDGNASNKLPIDVAIKDGCTDIFIVTTSSEKERESKNNWYWLFGKIFMKSLSKSFMSNYRKQIKKYNHDLEVAFGKKDPDGKVNIYTISPDYPVFVGEIRAQRLKKVEKMGMNKVINAFSGEK
jgi:predicted patatin/cPLA2 family phospholipase